jgi:hypothetical protein
MDGKSQSLQSNLDNQKYKSMSTNHSPELEFERPAGECYGSSLSMPSYHSVEFTDGSPQYIFQREAVIVSIVFFFFPSTVRGGGSRQVEYP